MRRALSFLLLLACLLTASAAAADEPAARCAAGWENDVFSAVKSSVVRISDGGGWGAGFVWKTPRRIVTAMHVVSRARSFDIFFADGSRGRARIVAGSENEDVAILELEGKVPELRPLELSDPAAMSVGDPVLAVGHPLAREKLDPRDEGLFTWSISRGVLAAWNDHRVQVDMQLNHGNSGGPILDCQGHVIGVASHTAGTIGFGVAPRQIVELDRAPVMPGVSLAPTGAIFNLGAALRIDRHFTYGPSLEMGVAFLGKVAVMTRVSGLFSFATEAAGDRLLTSRTGLHGALSLAYGFLFLQTRVLPNVAAAVFVRRDNAARIFEGRFTDDSSTSTSLRFAPGVSFVRRFLWADYKLELDFGRLADSAHLVTFGLSLF